MKEPENLYTDSAAEPASHGNQEEPGYGEEQGRQQDPEDEGTDETMFEAPKSALAGKDFKPGEEVMFEVVALHGDSVTLRYAKEHSEAEEKPGEPGEGGMEEGPVAPPSASDNPGSNYY